jgi:hypothetical protein
VIQMTCIRSKVFIVANTESLRRHMQSRKYIWLLFSVLTAVEVYEFEPNVCIQMTCIRSKVFIVANTGPLRRHMLQRKYIGLLFSVLTAVEVHEFEPNVCILNGL